MILFLGAEVYLYKFKYMKKLVFFFLVLVSMNPVSAQQNYVPSSENLKNRAWFEESRFGVFIHWGVYSVLGDGEWVMNNQNFGLNEYSLLPDFFNPIAFDAAKWAKLFKDSGAKYITFTSRHHDGFSMWNSQVSDYNIVKATPFKRDIVKELVEACRKEDIKVMFYYSLLDWSRDDYLPTGKTGKGIIGRDSTQGNWDSYIQFMKDQLTELFTNYGQIDGIWFDGHWDKPEADWKYNEIYSLIHQLQPQCLIGNNHHLATFEGEDFQMFERDLPGQNTTGFGTSADQVGNLPKEVCGTIAGSWGFDIKDRKQKSFKEVLTYLIKAAGYGSNLLLNIGPMPNGKIQDYQQDRLLDLGNWLSKYGETIYGTTGGFIIPTDEYALTKKANKIYIHIFNPNQEKVLIKDFVPEIRNISNYDDNKSVSYAHTDSGLEISLPKPIDKDFLILTLDVK